MFLRYLISKEGPRDAATFLGIAIPFYVIACALAFWIRRPVVCAALWLILRIVATLPFVVAGSMVGGDEGFVIFAWNFLFDVPLMPLHDLLRWLAMQLGADIDEELYFVVGICWYLAGGYFVARFARKDRVEYRDR